MYVHVHSRSKSLIGILKQVANAMYLQYLTHEGHRRNESNVHTVRIRFSFINTN